MAKYHKFNILSSKKVGKSPTVSEAVSNFLISKKSMNCTPKTVQSYTDALKPFVTFCGHLLICRSKARFSMQRTFTHIRLMTLEI